MYKYLITLKPLEPFFFGGEYTFGADDTRKETSRYSAKSTEFPQQTAILGMLRKTLLIQNGNLTMHRKGEWVDSGKKGGHNPNYEEAKALVGVKPFSYEKNIDLGIIKAFSPLFIKEGEHFYFPNAKDDGLELKELIGANISFGNGAKKAYGFENYDAKNHKSFAYTSLAEEKKNYSDFFKELESVGIKKSTDRETNEDGFFRKKSFYPKNSASFAFVATFSKEMEWLKESIVTLGADQSSFKLDIEFIKEEDDVSKRVEDAYEAKNFSRIVLSSETLLTKDAYALCSFILGERKSNRQLVNSRNGKKSKRYYLLEKGSVLYTEDIEKLEELLKQEHLQNIGINHYVTIKGKNNV
jgi:CRISPR-associated protein Cmr3